MELDTVHMAHELIGIGGTVDHEREKDSWALSEIEGLVDESEQLSAEWQNGDSMDQDFGSSKPAMSETERLEQHYRDDGFNSYQLAYSPTPLLRVISPSGCRAYDWPHWEPDTSTMMGTAFSWLEDWDTAPKDTDAEWINFQVSGGIEEVGKENPKTAEHSINEGKGNFSENTFDDHGTGCMSAEGSTLRYTKSSTNFDSSDKRTVTQDTQYTGSICPGKNATNRYVVSEPQPEIQHPPPSLQDDRLSSVDGVTPRQGYRLRTLFARALAEKMGDKVVPLTRTASMGSLQKEWDAILKTFAYAAQKSTQDKLLRKAASALRKIGPDVRREFESLFIDQRQDRVEVKELPLIVKKLDAENPPENSHAKVEAYIQSVQKLKEEIIPIREPIASYNTERIQPVVEAARLPISRKSNPSKKWQNDLIVLTDQDERAVYDYFTKHSAFGQLVDTVKRVLAENNHVEDTKRIDATQMEDTMELIEARVKAAFSTGSTSTSRQIPRVKTASVQFDVDIPLFLSTQYRDYPIDDIGAVLTITGHAQEAQLLPVYNYFEQTWKCHTHTLLDRIKSALRNPEQKHASTQQIIVDLHSRRITAAGDENFMIVVCQQVAWICAALRYTETGLSSARATFDLLPKAAHQTNMLHFEINTKLAMVTKSERSSSCWCNFLPASVIAAGFPVAPRSESMRGLELPLETMCALSGARIVSRFMDGYIIMMQNSALVPIERVDRSIRWHYIQGHRSLSYRDVHRQFPMRLKYNQRDEKLWTNGRTFLDCWTQIVEVATTMDYDFEAVHRSGNLKPMSPWQIELTGGTLGWNKWFTATMNFNIPYNRFRYLTAKQPDHYLNILEQAHLRQVIFIDTDECCAYAMDGEKYILHTIRHRRASGCYDTEAQDLVLHGTYAQHDSIRLIMRENETKMLRRSGVPGKDIENKLFRDEVKEIHECLESQTAHLRESRSWKTRHVRGFSWLSVARGPPELQVFRYRLPSSAGMWPELLADKNALFLFGSKIGGLIRSDPGFSCQKFSSVPPGFGLLAIATVDLTEILRSEYRLQIDFNSEIFSPCNRTYAMVTKQQLCDCDRVCEVKRMQSYEKSQEDIDKLPRYGAILLGTRGLLETGWMPKVLHRLKQGTLSAWTSVVQRTNRGKEPEIEIVGGQLDQDRAFVLANQDDNWSDSDYEPQEQDADHWSNIDFTDDRDLDVEDGSRLSSLSSGFQDDSEDEDVDQVEPVLSAMETSTSSVFTRIMAESSQSALTSTGRSTTTSEIRISPAFPHDKSGLPQEFERPQPPQGYSQASKLCSSMHVSYAKVAASGHLQSMRTQENSRNCEERLHFVSHRISMSRIRT